MGRHHQRDGGIVLQPPCLSALNARIAALDSEAQARFAVALFWVVALDQWMWSLGQTDYPSFRARTRFPKVVGNCKSACYNNQPPKAVLFLVGADGEGWSPDLPARVALLRETSSEVQALVASFAAEWRIPSMRDAMLRELRELELPVGPMQPLITAPPMEPLPTSWLMPPAPAPVLRTGRKSWPAGFRVRSEQRPAMRAVLNRAPTRIEFQEAFR